MRIHTPANRNITEECRHFLNRCLQRDPASRQVRIPVLPLNQCYGSGSAWIRNFSDSGIRNKSADKKVFINLGLWILDCLYYRTEVWNRKWQIVDRFFFLIECQCNFFCDNFQICLKNTGWIRIRVRNWIRIRNSEISLLDPDPE